MKIWRITVIKIKIIFCCCDINKGHINKLWNFKIFFSNIHKFINVSYENIDLKVEARKKIKENSHNLNEEINLYLEVNCNEKIKYSNNIYIENKRDFLEKKTMW